MVCRHSVQKPVPMILILPPFFLQLPIEEDIDLSDVELDDLDDTKKDEL